MAGIPRQPQPVWPVDINVNTVGLVMCLQTLSVLRLYAHGSDAVRTCALYDRGNVGRNNMLRYSAYVYKGKFCTSCIQFCIKSSWASFRMAQWIRRPPTERKIPGSIPGVEAHLFAFKVSCMCIQKAFCHRLLALESLSLLDKLAMESKYFDFIHFWVAMDPYILR